MIILHFDLQPQFKYMNYFVYTSNHFTPHGRYELNELTSLQMCGFIAQLVGRASHWYRGGHGFESRWSLDFFQASSFQLLKLENLLRWSFFTLNVFLPHSAGEIWKCNNYRSIWIYVWRKLGEGNHMMESFSKRFRKDPSTLERRAGIFKFLRFEDCLRKAPF